jgi:hypothetical protein
MNALKNTISLAIILLMVSCVDSKKENKQNEVPSASQEEWEVLLEGNSLDKWQMFNGEEMKGWEVIDGELHASGAGWDADEDIITKKEYENFELSLEWKIETANSSGIFYHVNDEESKAIYESAPEYQVLDDKGWPEEMKPNQYTGANYAMHVPRGALVKPVGEWNTSRIVVKNPHVEHWLNDMKVVEYELWSEDWKERKASGKWAEVPEYGMAESGHIGLQNAGKVVYRNIKIREL